MSGFDYDPQRAWHAEIFLVVIAYAVAILAPGWGLIAAFALLASRRPLHGAACLGISLVVGVIVFGWF